MTARVLHLQGGFNFRELGGYLGTDDRPVRWHRLLRTAHLASLTPADCLQLQAIGVRLVIDLRSTAETQAAPDRLGPQMRYCHLPVFDDDEAESAASVAELQRRFSRDPRSGYHRMMRVYRRLVTAPQAQAAYRRLFPILLQVPCDEGIIFHCSAGKDRTGMAAIFILAALGVSSEQLLADYLLTNPASAEHIDQRVAAVKLGNGRTNFQHAVRDLASVNPDYFEQALSLIDYAYGGLTPYLRDVLGVATADRMALQRRFLLPH